MGPIVRASLVEQVALKLKDRILDGTYRAGEPLPSHRELAQALEVSRETARAAVQHLVARGYLTARPRAAMRVARVDRSGGLEVMLDLVSSILEQGRDLRPLRAPLEGLERLHRIVFAEAAALAATRYDRADEQSLLMTFGELETHLTRGHSEQVMDGQAAVVAAIATASGPVCFGLTLNPIHRVWAKVRQHVEPGVADSASRGYFDCLERAILGRETSTARELVLETPFPGWLELARSLVRDDADGPGR